MSAHVLVSGTLFHAPEERTGKTSGKSFVAATIKVRDGEVPNPHPADLATKATGDAQAAARVAHNLEIRMRAARRAGVRKGARGENRRNFSPHRAEKLSKAKVLADAGVSTQQASDWE